MNSSCTEFHAANGHGDQKECYTKWKVKTAYDPAAIIYELSDELLSLILSFVPYSPKQYRTLILVSKRFNRLVDSPAFRKQAALTTYPLLMKLHDVTVVQCAQLWWLNKEYNRIKQWAFDIAPEACDDLAEIVLLGMQVFTFLSGCLAEHEKAELQLEGYRLRVIQRLKELDFLPQTILRILRYTLWHYLSFICKAIPNLLKEGPPFPATLSVPYEQEELKMLIKREIHDLKYVSWRCFIEYVWLTTVSTPGESVVVSPQSDIATHTWQQFKPFFTDDWTVPHEVETAFGDREFFEKGLWNVLSPDIQPSDPPSLLIVRDQWYGPALGLEIGKQEIIIDSYKQRPDLCLVDLEDVNWTLWGKGVRWYCEELAVK